MSYTPGQSFISPYYHRISNYQRKWFKFFPCKELTRTVQMKMKCQKAKSFQTWGVFCSDSLYQHPGDSKYLWNFGRSWWHCACNSSLVYIFQLCDRSSICSFEWLKVWFTCEKTASSLFLSNTTGFLWFSECSGFLLE